ncbi:MAG: hypothetical protein DI621_04705 [Pseudomonas protegens]|nr:MAG: hypothetical protein DI621_04705 [Pseudomonas protegens]
MARCIRLRTAERSLALYENYLRFDQTALKTGSECSFRFLNSASSPVFALPDLCSASFRTDPGIALFLPASGRFSNGIRPGPGSRAGNRGTPPAPERGKAPR